MGSRPVAVVTGASRGIGRAIAIELSRSGFDIVGIARTLKSGDDKKGLTELEPLIKEAGAAFLPIEADIAEIERHEELIAQILDAFGRLDLLVNNAGVTPLERQDLLVTTPESFDRVLRINLRGAFFLTQNVAQIMIEHRGRVPNRSPRIVFITSVSAEASSTNRAEYCISKAGLSMAARVFAERLAGTGIGVYEIRPGIVETDMTAPVKESYDQKIASGLIPQNRWGRPEDVAKAVQAIALGNFDYSTGMVVEVSGGMNIRRL